MQIISFLTSSLLLLTAQGTFARRHHDALAARTTGNSTVLEPRWTPVNTKFPILKPGDKWGYDPPAIATSYEPDNGVSLSGACGWNGSPKNLANGQRIYGNAQMYSVFGNGVSCGTCLRLNPTDKAKYGNIGPFIVTVTNSCPPPCKSLDLEVDGIVAWLKQPRVGQLGIVGEVVPCNFRKNGVFIEIYQFSSHNPYDLRMGIRGNSGAVALAEIACHNTNNFVPLKKENPSQYTPQNGQGIAPSILKCHSLDFKVTNFKQETVMLNNVPNKIYGGDGNAWHNTGTNFEWT